MPPVVVVVVVIVVVVAAAAGMLLLTVSISPDRAAAGYSHATQRFFGDAGRRAVGLRRAEAQAAKRYQSAAGLQVRFCRV